jgi:hypothetical protein
MDALDRVAAPGRDLLDRVDAVLMGRGAPADHAIWPLLRRIGALPGDMLAAFVALRPEPLLAAGAAVRRRAEECVEERSDLDAAVAAAQWEGDAASGFLARWRALATHLGDRAAAEQESLAGRLAATASYVDDVAAWVRAARLDLARAVTTALGSLDALQVRAGDPAGGGRAPVLAAAAIGALVLETAGRHVDAAGSVAEGWAARLGDLPFRPVAQAGDRSGAATRVAR